MAFTTNQTRTVQLWLTLAVLLAVFPPMVESKTFAVSPPITVSFSASAHHAFVLGVGKFPVNVPGMPENITDRSTGIQYFLTKEISAAAMLCELLSLTGIFGVLFIHFRVKD